MKNRKGLFKHSEKFTRNYIAWQLYDTVIFIERDDKYILNTDGFKTNHTKNCMNDLLPNGFRVFQKDFKWFIETPKGNSPFQDGIVVYKQ